MLASKESPLLVFPVQLGSANAMTLLFSYPNVPESSETLIDTMEHWLNQSLSRDGLADKGASLKVQFDGTDYSLIVQAPPVIANQALQFAKNVAQSYWNGSLALVAIAQIQQDNPGIWDPTKNGWRFMLPQGLPVVNQRSMQLFHYPPMNLMNPLQDYLNDAVPTRWAELLQANGMTDMSQIVLMERLLDCAPIAAGDSEGTHISATLTPTDYFKYYQLAQFYSFLTPSVAYPGYTIPLIVCGAPPRTVLAELFNVTLGVNQTASVEIIPGLKTAVLAANHPYYFYAKAQGFDTVGDGTMIPANCAAATQIMVQDLTAARWQMLMADNPSLDPQATLNQCTAYWNSPAQAPAVCAMVQHEGTLFYTTPNDPSTYTFKTSLPQAAQFCQSHANNPCASP